MRRMLKTAHNSGLGSEKSSTHSGGYARGFSLPAASVDDGLDHREEEMVLA